MALPQHKTCLSILRSILGPGAGNEARFAEKIGRSTSWLKKASCGQISLTRDAALAIAYATGASVKWLLAGDPTKPLLDSEGNPYTLETYAKYRTQDREEKDRDDIALARDEMTGCIHKLLQILGAANLKNRGGLFTFRLGNFVDEMADKFGVADIYQNEGAAQIAERAADLVREWDAKKQPLVYVTKNNKGELSAQIDIADIFQNEGADGKVEFRIIKGDAKRISLHNLKPQKKQPSRKSKRPA